MNQMVQMWQLLNQQQQAGLLPSVDVHSAFMQALQTHNHAPGLGCVSPYQAMYGLAGGNIAQQYDLETQDAPTVIEDDSWMEENPHRKDNSEDNDF